MIMMVVVGTAENGVSSSVAARAKIWAVARSPVCRLAIRWVRAAAAGLRQHAALCSSGHYMVAQVAGNASEAPALSPHFRRFANTLSTGSERFWRQPADGSPLPCVWYLQPVSPVSFPRQWPQFVWCALPAKQQVATPRPAVPPGVVSPTMNFPQFGRIRLPE